MSALLLDKSERQRLSGWLTNFRIVDGAPRRPDGVDSETWRQILCAELSAVPINVLAAISDLYGTTWMDVLRWPSTGHEARARELAALPPMPKD